MAKFSDRLAAAKAKEPPFQDVRVVLDDLLAEERKGLQDRIAEARKPTNDPRLGKKSPLEALQTELAELEIREADAMETVRVYRAAGTEWAALTARFPVRDDAVIDLRFGFNIHGLMEAEGHRWCRILEDGEPVKFDIVTERDAISQKTRVVRSEWADFTTTISPDDYSQIIDAAFNLNVWEPQMRRDRLGKAGSSTNASSSPSASE